MATAILKCDGCGIDFTIKSSPAIIKRQRFCSRACFAVVLRSRVRPMLESFKERLSERSYVADNGCIIYTGQSNGNYGQIEYRRKTYLAHRAAYMVAFGDIPAGFFVCHTCDVRHCINPAHLWAGTHKENMADMSAKGRASKFGNKLEKIPAADIPKIRSRIESGEKAQAIANEYGVSHSIISMIKHGKRRALS